MDTGWMTGVQFLIGVRDFYLMLSVQTGSGVHPGSYPMGTGVCFPWDTAASVVKLTTHLPLVLRSRMVDQYIHSPIHLHGMVHNELSTGTVLPYLIHELFYSMLQAFTA
jgi:hypothetical protein